MPFKKRIKKSYHEKKGTLFYVYVQDISVILTQNVNA